MNNNSNSEPYNEGEWEEKEDLLWSELEWRDYLKKLDKEIERFLQLYAELPKTPELLDEAVHLMEWEPGEGIWNEVDTSEEIFTDEAHEDAGDSHDADLYTLHRHPLFIVTQALYRDLRRIWEDLMRQSGGTLNPTLVWDLANSFNKGEVHAILAVQALDMEDYTLSLCHLKDALVGLNASLGLLQSITSCNPQLAAAFQKELHRRLFDLRELWLRAMNDCREQVRLQADDKSEG